MTYNGMKIDISEELLKKFEYWKERPLGKEDIDLYIYNEYGDTSIIPEGPLDPARLGLGKEDIEKIVEKYIRIDIRAGEILYA